MSVETLREHALRSLTTLPPFSPVLNKLLAEMSADYISLHAISALMERDTVIAGNILKIANSAAYGRRVEVTSICHAASLLGMDRLRNAVLGLSMTRMWNHVRAPRELSLARFNLHGLAVAILSDLLAQRTLVRYSEGAFLAGLFHDLGHLLIAIGLPDSYEEIVALRAGSKASWIDCEREVLGFTHADISGAACAHWNLPGAINIAVLHHHDTATTDPGLPFGTYPLAAIVHTANRFANASGISLEKSHASEGADLADVLEKIGLGASLAEIAGEFETQFAPLTSFFG